MVDAAGASTEEIGSMMAGGASGKVAGAALTAAGQIPEAQHGETV
jgi:hypothetical protein